MVKIKRLIIPSIFFWPHHKACWILVPQPGIEPIPPTMEAQKQKHGVLTTGLPGKTRYQVLMRTLNNWNSHTLLVENAKWYNHFVKQFGSFSFKTQNKTKKTLFKWFQNPTVRYLSKRNKSICSHRFVLECLEQLYS